MIIKMIVYNIFFLSGFGLCYNLNTQGSNVVSNFVNYFIPEALISNDRKDDFLPDEETDNIMFKPPLPGTWNKNPKMISISPAGIYGFYTLGTCAYIKENYDVSDYIFSGASAGSWNSLYMVLKNDLELYSLSECIGLSLHLAHNKSLKVGVSQNFPIFNTATAA